MKLPKSSQVIHSFGTVAVDDMCIVQFKKRKNPYFKPQSQNIFNLKIVSFSNFNL